MHNLKKKGAQDVGKLIVEGNSVYEVDEECMKRRAVPAHCEVLEAMKRMEQRGEERKASVSQSQNADRL